MKQFRTSDLCLAAYLSYSGYEIQGVTDDQDRPERKVFAFNEDSQFENHILAFGKRQAVVEPTRYFLELRQLKSQIYGHNIIRE